MTVWRKNIKIGTTYKQKVNELAKEKEQSTEYEATEEQAEKQSTNSGSLPPNVVEGKNRWWLKYLITATVLSVFTVLVAWSQGAFSITDTQALLGALSTAFFVPGVLALGFGLLVFCSNGGAFDMVSYGFQSLFRLYKKDPRDHKYGGYYEYREARKQKKRTFWYLVIVGAVFVLVGGILLICFNYAF